jgi:hypothetical protein
MSRRCPRCRQRIVVKRVSGRNVYLTEAAVAVFAAEHRKEVNARRWTRDRAQWLALATSVGAAESKLTRLGAAQLSAEVVESARRLYVDTAERSYRVARREHRWEDAARMRREQAQSLHRLAGSPRPPSAAVIAIHREAAAAELRALAEIVRDAELVGVTCCDACRADNGRIFPIAKELATPRLPHVGCPRGLCRCSWDLATRDRAAVLRYVRRRPRPKARAEAEDAGTAT